MKKRPKNKNKTKLKGAEASKSAPVVQADNKYYERTSAHDALHVRYPVLEKPLLDYVAEMHKNRKLCVTTNGTLHHPQRQQNQKRNAGGCGLVC
ncbi:hypothetical protein PC113_g130 [Phytophthora cactorum]|uniref:Uncharacterized protein n=1 Tax=Phytophthora cactorum TaxID=29920 RepID=A0A8T1A281_9STRA|nr:hypothetical protein PC113_g130 [Phytophthora cactorum]